MFCFQEQVACSFLARQITFLGTINCDEIVKEPWAWVRLKEHHHILHLQPLARLHENLSTSAHEWMCLHQMLGAAQEKTACASLEWC